MKSVISRKERITDPDILHGNIAYTTPKGFCIFTHWQSFYYVYPKRKRMYSLLYASSFESKKGIWK